MKCEMAEKVFPMVKTEWQKTVGDLEKVLEVFPASLHFALRGADKTLDNPIAASDYDSTASHILFVKDGKGVCDFPEGSIDLYRGIVLYIGRDIQWRIHSDSGEPLEIIEIHFDMVCDSDEVSIPSFMAYFIPDDILKIGIRFHSLYENVNDPSQSTMVSAGVNAFIGQTLLDMYRHAQQQNAVIDPRIETAHQLIEMRKHRNISVKDLAKQAGISERHFRTLFHEAYGMTPKQYHRKVRMHYARFLLREANFSVKQAALEVGYSDVYTFSHQYKEHYGCPPSVDSGDTVDDM